MEVECCKIPGYCSDRDLYFGDNLAALPGLLVIVLFFELVTIGHLALLSRIQLPEHNHSANMLFASHHGMVFNEKNTADLF